MKTYIQTCCCALTLAGAFTLVSSASLRAEESSPMPSEMAEMMKKAEAAATPGKAHQALNPLVGSWDVEVQSWMAPGAPPVISKGSAETKWIFGERFLQEEFESEFMGKPFQGMAILGFDNLSQTYNHVWIDNFSTTIYVREGKASDDGKEFVFEGESDCPITEKPQKTQHVLRILSPDKYVMEMYNITDGAKLKFMEITYTRK